MSTPERYEQIRAVFLAAREKKQATRAAYLDEACGDDAELRREVETLLSSDEQAESFLRTPALGAGFALRPPEDLGSSARVGDLSTVGARSTQRHPDHIGRYRILGVIGEGGMGVVYKAEQDSPRRVVALKVIKPGIESRETLKRFAHEGQMLGWLQHPGIAQVYEAGTADTGHGPQPFFAMEYIQGQPLNQYAHARHLGIRERLVLLARICDAVQHAHQKGVIHRDLKPGNILVDAAGQPKILDFGVARATDADIRTTTVQTAVGQLVGTLAYMSPEQVAGNPADLDTRADVYALGVIGYELLTGRTPVDVVGKTIPQAARAIAEEEPTSPGTLNRALRGDIEAIICKALEKDKEQRYASASDLASDIRRYLSNQPITARPITTFYQLRKFASRNKPLVGGVLTTFAALVIAIVGTLSQAIRAGHQRDRALDAERVAEERRSEAEQQRAEAERQAAIAQAVNEFLNTDLLAAASPEERGRDVTVREVVDAASEHVADRFGDQPLVEAAVRLTLGNTYRGLGLYEQAKPHLERALEIYRAQSEPDDRALFTAITDLGRLHCDWGRVDEAEPLLVEALASAQRREGDEGRDTLGALNNLAALYDTSRRYVEAEPVCRKAVEIARRTRAPDDEYTLTALHNLSYWYSQQGRFAEAEPLLVEIMEARQRTGGRDNPRTLQATLNLAGFYYQQDRLTESEALYVDLIPRLQRVFGEAHPHVQTALHTLAAVYLKQDRPDDAERLYRQALDLQERASGPDNVETLNVARRLGEYFFRQKRYDEAEPLFVRVLEGRRRQLGADDRDTLNAQANLALLYLTLDRREQSEALYTDLVTVAKRALGPEDPDTLQFIRHQASFYAQTDQIEKAVPLYRESYEGRARVLGPDSLDTLMSMRDLVVMLIKLERYAEAEPLAVECANRFVALAGPQNRNAQKAIGYVSELYRRWGKTDLATEWYAKLNTDQAAPAAPPK